LVDEILIRFDGDEVKVTAVGALDELKRQQFLSPGNDIGSCSQRVDDMCNKPEIVLDQFVAGDFVAFGHQPEVGFLFLFA